MYIELVCKNCGKRFQLDFEKEDITLEKCPKCNIGISASVEEMVRSLTEKYYSAQRSTTDKFDIVGVFNGAKNHVFSSDVEAINELFNISSQQVKEKITLLLDKIYLLMYHDAKDCNLESLDKTIEAINTIFYNKISNDNNSYEELIGVTKEDNNND